MKENVIIIGAGGHAKVVIDCIEQENKYEVSSVADDVYDNRSILHFKVIKKEKNYVNQNAIIAIGNGATRKSIAQELQSNFVTTIHPTAVISNYAKIGKGCQVFASAVVNAGATVGQHVIINTGAIVEHDCWIGDYVHLSPNCCLGGNVTVGAGTHIGIGATVIQGITIGANVIVGAGAVVVSNIPDNCTAVGIPAKPIKFHDK